MMGPLIIKTRYRQVLSIWLNLLNLVQLVAKQVVSLTKSFLKFDQEDADHQFIFYVEVIHIDC